MTAPKAAPALAGNPLLSKASVEWWTPLPIVEAARSTMGRIDLDPASSDAANLQVGATDLYSQQSDGLDPLNRWSGSVFLNPPGGSVRQFWERLCHEYVVGNVRQAVWIGYSLDQLQVLQSSPYCPLDFPLCFPNKRIAFIAPQGGKNSPTHGNYIAFLPPPDPAGVERFADRFGRFGKVRP